ncbi:NRDE family protein [Colwellia sp. RE-S-Sl-9]
MCILFIALKQHPKYPVIICANRDEFHQRPTQNLHVWPENSILAGKDLQAGGTWLGLTQSEHFSALTNFRQPHLIDNTKTSRGNLVLKALSEENIASKNENIRTHLVNHSHIYNGFNLIYGNLDKLYCFDSVHKKEHVMNNGVYSICNGALTDSWPKMTRGQQKLKALITNEKHENELDGDLLLALMNDTVQAPLKDLPKTGLPTEREALLSSIFITSPDYGTRSTIIITKDLNNNVEITECTYLPSGDKASYQQFSLKTLFTPS